MTEETYKVTVKGAGLELDRDVSAEVGEQVVMLILTGKKGNAPANGSGPDTLDPANAQPDRATAAAPRGSAGMSIREYLDSCEAKRSPDKITAIGNFLKEQRNQECFNRLDLERLFQDAAEPIPKNIPRDLKWTTRAGWIAPKPDEKGSYYVTAKGTDAVRKKFPKDIIKKTSQVPARSKRSAVSKRSKE